MATFEPWREAPGPGCRREDNLYRLLGVIGDQVGHSCAEFLAGLAAGGTGPAEWPSHGGRHRERLFGRKAMARMPMTCMCGWSFFVPDSQPGAEVACPSCRNPVPLPGRKRRATATVLPRSSRGHRRQGGPGAIVALCAIAAVLLGVIVYLLAGGRDGSPSPVDNRQIVTLPDPPSNNNSIRDRAGAMTHFIDQPNGPSGEAPSPENQGGQADPPAREHRDPDPPDNPHEADGKPEVDYADLIDRHVALCNVGVMVSTVLKYRRKPDEDARLQKKITGFQAAINEYRLALLDRKEQKLIPEFLEAGDAIVFFDGEVLARMGRTEGLNYTENHLRQFRPGQWRKFHRVRDGVEKAVMVNIPYLYPELKQLTKEFLGFEMGAGGKVPPIRDTISASVLDDIEKRFAALPAGYRLRIPASDRARLERLKKAGEGSSQDLEWITRTLPALLAEFEQEAKQVKKIIAKAEADMTKVKETVVVHFLDGRRIEGVLLEKTDDRIRLETLSHITFGSPLKDVKKIEYGKGAVSQFPDKFKDARGNGAKMVALMAWCKEHSLVPHRKYVAGQVWELDPGNGPARSALDLK